ncbi:MAG: YybH family protein [Pseudomonadota bacterium]|jgi:ketosteroid isomerase-like protein
MTSAPEERAIRDLLERRRIVWNSRDPVAYRALLTDDIEIISATGRTSHGIDEAIRLYTEQKQQPSYRKAVITATLVHRVTMHGAAAAEADATYRMSGVCIPPDSPPRDVEGEIVFAVRKEGDSWKIASLRARPPAADEGGR